jgi:dolichol-phosphate mannosyltransferase
MRSATVVDETIDPPVQLAEIRVLTPVSIVVPTYKEAESLPHLLGRIEALRSRYDLELDCS